MQWLPRKRYGHGDILAALFNPQPPRPDHIRLNLPRHRSLCLAILERCQAISVQRCIGVSRVFIETLPNNQTRLAMRIATSPLKLNIGSEDSIAIGLGPNK